MLQRHHSYVTVRTVRLKLNHSLQLYFHLLPFMRNRWLGLKFKAINFEIGLILVLRLEFSDEALE